MEYNKTRAVASRLGAVITKAIYDSLQKHDRTDNFIEERIVLPIYVALKNQHEADIEKAIAFINDDTRKFSCVEDVKFQFKKYMEE